ncbi:MAG: MogA/MoaB family molybdenum cofactor biosynthesis protein [Bacteroidetes bacterium]|nr:MogA/MoaB family molybdenum cofactor biosynthesis protein [Bacteroidota bacterium]MCY4205872.1 MogA/MoaB family molybdenum cofactor biosynthesis protein [Bacteroidota bacterium]
MSTCNYNETGSVVRFSLITISDTRTPVTDESGPVMAQLVRENGHQIISQLIVPDEPERIQKAIYDQSGNADVVCLSGGTGISPRDQTYEAVRPLLDKELSGFGELFRLLSWEQVGSRSMMSRALAGTCSNLIIFALPGSPKGAKLAMEKLILPEARHLVTELYKQ